MSEAESRSYYYSNEAAKRLGIPETDMWRMKSIQTLSDGKQTFPKKTVDSMADSWGSVLCKQYLEATENPGDQFNAIYHRTEALLKENSHLRAKNTEARQSADLYKSQINEQRSQLNKKSRECTKLSSDMDSLRKLTEYLKSENQALRAKIDVYETVADKASTSGEKKSFRERLSGMFKS